MSWEWCFLGFDKQTEDNKVPWPFPSYELRSWDLNSSSESPKPLAPSLLPGHTVGVSLDHLQPLRWPRVAAVGELRGAATQ